MPGALVDLVEIHGSSSRLVKPRLSFPQDGQDRLVDLAWGVISHRCHVERQGPLTVLRHDGFQVSAVMFLGWEPIVLAHFLDQRCVDTAPHGGERGYLVGTLQRVAVFWLSSTEHRGVPQG